MPALFTKYLHRATTSLHQNNIESALKSINSALHIDPSNLEALQKKVEILQRSGHFQHTVECLTQALQHHPHQTWWVLDLAELLINRLQRPDEALFWLGRLFRCRSLSSTEEQRATRLQAEALIDQERLYEAWLVLRKASSTYPNDLDLLFLRGWVTLQLGRYCASASTFQKILRRNNDHTDAHYYLGVAYEGMGEFTLMQRHFAATYRLDKLFPPELRFSAQQFKLIAQQAIAQETCDDLHIQLSVLPYPPSSILDEYPHDPRRMGILRQTNTPHSSKPTFRLTLFQWNVERLAFTEHEILEEISIVLQQELEENTPTQLQAIGTTA